MRAIVFSDAHVDAGGGFGEPDAEWGNTRARDVADMVNRVCQEECDVLIFGGDVAKGPAPRPRALATIRDALAGARARHVLLTLGNHDYLVGKTVLDVVRPRNGIVVRDPRLIDLRKLTVAEQRVGLQVGVLPWAPPSRLVAPGVDKTDANRQVAAIMHDMARGLGQQVDAQCPAILIGHWLVSGSQMPNGISVMEAREPVLNADELELSGSWTVCLYGHNHKPQAIAEHSHVIGSLAREDWGEATYEPSYLIIDVEEDGRVHLDRRASGDRPMVDLTLTAEQAMSDDDEWLPAVADALVRIRVTCTEDQVRDLQDTGTLDEMRDAAVLAGALKVFGPELRPQIKTRDRRSASGELDADPRSALPVWLEQQGITGDRASRVLAAADTIINATEAIA